MAKDNGYAGLPDFLSFEVKEIVNKELVNSKPYKSFEEAQKELPKPTKL